VLVVGATGLIGRCVMEQAVSQPWVRLVALTRREAPMPRGALMEMLVADPSGWQDAVATIAPDAIICALGTTIAKAGSEEAFRAVDHDLVLSVARAAKAAGVANFVLISSTGADPHAKAFYLAVKGQTEVALGKLRLRRLDILRPGLLRGRRPGEIRWLERMAMLASPITDVLLQGSASRYRSIAAGTVASAALQFTREKPQGRFVHDNTAIERAARRLGGSA